MNELIKVIEKNGKKVFAARDLYSALGYDDSQFSRWHQDKIKNNPYAIEGVDYQYIDYVVDMPNGGQRSMYDCALSLDFCKRLSMIAKTYKGEGARLYFIEMEKKAIELSSPKELSRRELAQMVIDAEIAKEIIEARVKELEPKAVVYDNISSAKNLLTLNEAAKSLGVGRNKWMKTLREQKILQSNNTPFQRYINPGYFEVKVTPINGVNHPQTYVTGNGLTWLASV